MRFTAIKTLGGALAAVAMLFAVSCATVSRQVVQPLEIPGAHYVGDQACADCHQPIVRQSFASPHAHLLLDLTNIPGGISCESCHGPGSKHVEVANANFIINPRKDPNACFRCHDRTAAEFQLPSHHPVIEGHMSCDQCHDPHGGDITGPGHGLAMARMNENCATCHHAETKPFIFEHPAMREGCATCHDAHGSINRMMLTQADNNLCLRCHAQVQGPGAAGDFYIGAVPHRALLQMGTCWSSGCHTAVHGSDIDPRLRY